MAPTHSNRSHSKLLAEWFWTDRWIGSSAFLLPLEARGLYREMLTQAWRRGARLPNDHEAIRRAVGCTRAEWRRCWPRVEHYWRVDGAELVNDTQRDIWTKTASLMAENTERAKRAAGARWHKPRAQPEHSTSNAQAHAQAMPGLCPPSPSPSPSPESTKKEREIARESEHFDSFETSERPDGQAWFTILRDTYPTERVTDNRETVEAFLHELGPVEEWPERFQLMLATLQEHKKSEQWKNPRFAPNLITWLKRGDWRGTRKLAGAAAGPEGRGRTGAPAKGKYDGIEEHD